MRGERCAERGRAAAVAVALLASIALPLEARAQTQPTASLVYVVAAEASGCPSEQVVRDLVVARLGYDPFDEHAALSMRISVSALERELVGAVELAGADGTAVGRREIRGTAGHCDALSETLAIAAGIALEALVEPAGAALQPPGAHGPPALEPLDAEPPPALARRQPRPREQTPAVPATVAERGPRIDLYAGPLGRLGASPAPGWGASVGASVGVATYTLGVEASFTTMPAASAVSGGVSLRTSLLSVGFVPCYALGVARVCAVAAIGSLESEAQVEELRVASTLFAYAGVRLGAVVPLGRRVAFGAHLDLAASLVRASFDIGSTSVWTNGPVLGELGLSLVLRP